MKATATTSTHSKAPHAEQVLARIGGRVNARTVSIAEIKTQWPAVEKKMHRKPMTLTYKGEPAAVLMSTAAYRQIVEALIEQIEDAEDLAAIERYNPEDCIPYEDVRADLKRNGRL